MSGDQFDRARASDVLDPGAPLPMVTIRPDHIEVEAWGRGEAQASSWTQVAPPTEADCLRHVYTALQHLAVARYGRIALAQRAADVEALADELANAMADTRVGCVDHIEHPQMRAVAAQVLASGRWAKVES